MHMDEQGWVSVYLIAGFPRILELTNFVDFILDSLKSSEIVEVCGDKIRRKNDWKKWIWPLEFHPTGR